VVAHGAIWGYAALALSRLLIFGTTVFLARLLTPAEFGIVGFALVLIGYLEVAQDLGVGSALIARPHIDHETASTAFYLSAGSGLALSAVVFLGAPLLADFFGDARTELVTRVLSIGLLLSALGSTHAALLSRELSFGKRIVPDVIQVAIRGSVSIGLALGGWGYWSLVAGQLAGQTSFCLAALALQPFRPRLEWDRDAARWLLGFGSSLVGSRMALALESNMAFLIVGNLLGAAALGLYILAYRVPELVLLSSLTVLSRVLFPAYARLQSDQEGLRRGYLLGQRYMALLALPVGAGIVLIAPLFVSVVYGPRWAEAAPALQLVTVRCALASIGGGAAAVAAVSGRARLQLWLSALPMVITLPGMVVAAPSLGLPGVAAAYAAGTLVTGMMRLLMARVVVQASLADVARELLPATAATAALAAGTGGFLLLAPAWPDTVRLLGAVAVGGAAYGVALLVVGRDLLRRLPLPSRLSRALQLG
jgi:O-antigen/teichoic acid export membrane protein